MATPPSALPIKRNPIQSVGRILAIKLLDEKYELDPQGPTGNAAVTKWYGYAPILSVESFFPKTQSTIFYGQSLYNLGFGVGVFDKQTLFTNFIRVFSNKLHRWGELVDIPVAPWLINIYLTPTVPQPPPVAHAKVIALGGGYDPSLGYWVEFQGNYWLTFPLFRPAPGYQPPQPTTSLNPNGPNQTQGPGVGGAGVLNGALPGSFNGPTGGKCS
jgi:hypothetical protein